MEYEDFVKNKRRLEVATGHVHGELNSNLFDFQHAIVSWAVRRGRAAIFADTGLGKTLMQLSWADEVASHTGGIVVVLAPLAVSEQTIEQGATFGIEVKRIPAGGTPDAPGVWITNYERINAIDFTSLAGIVLDECFPPETEIDVLSIDGSKVKKYIKDVCVGDQILNASGVDVVSDIHRREVQYAVKVTVNGREITSSPNHPYFTKRGWVGAIDLRPGDQIMETAEAVRLVQDSIHANRYIREDENILREILLSEMANEPAGKYSEGSHKGSACFDWSEEVSLVQDTGCGGGVGKNNCAKSNAKSRDKRQGEPHIEIHEARTFRAWGKREAINRAADGVDGCIIRELDCGISYLVGETKSGLSDLLQGGLSISRNETRDRGGWVITSQPESAGPEKGRDAGFARVESIEVLEQGHPELEKYRNAEGKLYFYDLGGTRHPSFSINGLLVHNSSILKSHDGKTRTAIIDACQSIPYRLSCTATPSPNDFEELGNQCEFLGVMTRTEMLATYFINDAGDTGTWVLKGWGQSRFWEWMGTWAVVLRSPADLGFDGSRYDLPALTYHEHVVQTEALGDELFSRPAQTMLERRKAQRDSIEARCAALAAVVNSEPDEPWLIWCHLNDEAELLQKLIPGSINVQGSDSPEFKVCGSRWFLSDDSLQNDVFSDKLSVTEKELLGWMTKKKLDALTCDSTTKKTKKSSGLHHKKSATNTTQQELKSTQKIQNGKKEQELLQENGFLKIQKSGKVSESSNTELMAQSTTECYQVKAVSAQSASLQVLETSAEDDSMLTTAIHLEKSEGFCVSHAITDLENLKTQKNHSNEQSSISKPARTGRVLISKARIFGYGLNFQHCARMAFVGLDDSFEKFYQAVRRCYRFGQKREVQVHIFTAENEGQILQNIKRKELLHHEMSANMIEHMKDIMNKELAGQENIVDEYQEATFEGDGFKVHMGDCVKWTRRMEDNSIDYSVFSPPFADLFVYSNSDHDMGNCANDEEFVAQLKFLIGELFRVIKPGRNVSFHCMNLPTTKMRQGHIGLRDFRGDLIRAFQDAGFIYHSEVCIWKDPVVAMQRTKALGLLHKTIRENSTMSRMGLPDYVVTMRKPGEIEERVTHGDDLPVMMWQKYASPIWDDINQSRTLNKMPARDDKDLKHMCPLQLDVIERCIHLWTNPGDTVFSPFTGIGSEGYCAVKMGRKFIGTELKPAYYELACQNIEDARKHEQDGLFAE